MTLLGSKVAVDQSVVEAYQGIVTRISILSALRAIGVGVLLGSIAEAQTALPPVQSGRAQLTHSLDSVAAAYTAARGTNVAAIHTRGEAGVHQAIVRKQILSLIGTLPERTPLNARILGSTQVTGLRIEKVLFDSQPGFPVTALLYIPEGPPSDCKLPAILITPGHGPAGKASLQPMFSGSPRTLCRPARNSMTFRMLKSSRPE